MSVCAGSRVCGKMYVYTFFCLRFGDICCPKGGQQMWQRLPQIASARMNTHFFGGDIKIGFLDNEVRKSPFMHKMYKYTLFDLILCIFLHFYALCSFTSFLNTICIVCIRIVNLYKNRPVLLCKMTNTKKLYRKENFYKILRSVKLFPVFIQFSQLLTIIQKGEIVCLDTVCKDWKLVFITS